MSRETEQTNRRLLRARDAMDRGYADPLDIPALARIAHVSPAHFIRTFRAGAGSFEQDLALGVTGHAHGPNEQPYGIDAGIRDPFGNKLRFVQPN